MGRDTGRDSAHVWLYAQVRLHPEIGFQELQGRRGLWGPETLGQDLLARSPCPPQWSLDSPVPSHTWRRGCFLSAGLGWFPLGRTAHPVPHRLTPASLLPLPGWGGAGQVGRAGRSGQTPTQLGNHNALEWQWLWQEKLQLDLWRNLPRSVPLRKIRLQGHKKQQSDGPERRALGVAGCDSEHRHETHQGFPGELPSLGLKQKRKERRKIPYSGKSIMSGA